MTTKAERLLAANSLEDVLEVRGDPMAVVHEVDWLKPFRKVPRNASPPLAMSPAHPRAVGSYGARHIAWAKKEQGVTYRWWQALAITRQLEHDKDGVLVYPELIETGPRRVGKSVRLRGVSCWRTDSAPLIGEKQLSMLVSKDLAIGKEIHRGSWRWAEQRGWKVTRLGGAQEIEKTEDESRWLLRADTAVYGYDICYAPVDEAWSVDPQSITEGLEPAMLERLWPQLHLTSTAHVRATSLMRRRLVAALRNADPNVLLLMWGARPGEDLAAEKTWREASPHWTEQRRALIARKYAAALAGQNEPEFDDPDPIRGWAAQYLNAWPMLFGSSDTILPGWSGLAAKPPAEEDRTVIALGVAADVGQAWLSLGAVIESEKPHLGSVLRLRSDERDHFVKEAARIQREHDCPIIIDRKGPAGFLIDDLEEAGAWLKIVGVDELVQACADMVSMVARSEVEHGDYADLNAAVAAAGWRKIGDRRAFARQNGDISSLEAAALALHAAELDYDALDSIL